MKTQKLEKLYEDLEQKLSNAVHGMKDPVWKVTACTEEVGYIKLPDGRTAKVTIEVDADKDNW